MTRFGALVFLLLCLNISGSQAQQCQEFKEGFKKYFQCILNCYRTHFEPGVFAGDLCNSEVTVEGLTPPENGYTADQIELSLDCIAHQCQSEIPPSVCEDSSTTAISVPDSTSENGSTLLISSTDVSATSDSSSSSGSTASLATDGLQQNELDNEEDCEDSVNAEAAAGNNDSPLSSTNAPTTSTDYSYEYYSDEEYSDESANSSPSVGNGKAVSNADVNSANGREASVFAAAQSQSNEKDLPKNRNPQLQNNDKGGADTYLQNSNNGNEYSSYSNTAQSLDEAVTDSNKRQINKEVSDTNMRNSNNANGYSYFSKAAQSPEAAGTDNKERQFNQQVSDNNMQNLNNGNVYGYNFKAAQSHGAAGTDNNERQFNQQVSDINNQNSNNGNSYSYYSKNAQSFPASGTDHNARQVNQQPPVSNLQYQNFGSQRNNQNQNQRSEIQTFYNQPQAIYQNYALQPPSVGNNLSRQQNLFSNNVNPGLPSNNALGYNSRYANNRVASASANSAGNSGGNVLNGYNSAFPQNYGTGVNSGQSPNAFSMSKSAASGGEAEASAGAFSSSSSSMSSGGNFNPSSLGVPPNNNGGPIRLNFGDDTLLINGKQVQWHRNNQLVNSFKMN